MEQGFQYGMLLGGIGLFLLGMMLMTEGLKTASGPALVKFLEKYTNTKLKGFISGFISTTALQSSTATTLLAIGFVNTGILTFANSLWLLFGANVGSTMMPWIIAVVGGGGFKISAFALPMIGIGIAMKMIKNKNIGAAGGVIAGFGLLFLGLDFLQTAFTGIEKIVPFAELSSYGIFSIFIFAIIGFILTVVMQSSAAVMAIILTLAASAGLPLVMAAAAVIGANVGTTATAFFAVIGATANAKRAAWAHIGFNIIAGIGAFCILPFFLQLTDYLSDIFHMEDAIATELALFHTSFNILGVLLMIPLSGFLAKFLSKRFTKDESFMEKPKYLDDTLLDSPTLAMEALIKEMERYRLMLIDSLRGFILHLQGKSSELKNDNKIDELGKNITDFIAKLTKSQMPDAVVAELQECLLVRDQYRKTSIYIKKLREEFHKISNFEEKTDIEVKNFLDSVLSLLETIDTTIEKDTEEFSEKNLAKVDTSYKNFKNFLVKSGTSGKISIEDMEKLTELARTLKRMLSAFAKVRRMDYVVDGK